MMTCQPGTYIGQAGSALMDRVCVPCPSGTFSTATDSTACMSWTVCNPGSYVQREGATNADRMCASCPAGSSTTSANQANCLSSLECQAGTVQSASMASDSAPVCLDCHAGYYCAGGSTAAVPCSAETWDNDGRPSTACVPRSNCPTGTYVSGPGSGTTDRVCSPCQPGSFTALENASTCVPWTVCPAGSYVSNLPTATTDRICANCAAGTFSTTENQSACLAVSSCAAGTVQSSGASSTGGRSCRACSTGEFCAGGTAPAVSCAGDTWDDDANPGTICVPKSACAPGTYVAQVGSATTDRRCMACPSGTFSATPNAPACLAWSDCAAGTYVVTQASVTGDRQCAACGVGTYSKKANLSVCASPNDCEPGTVQTAAGTPTQPPVCTACPMGQYCAGGTSPAQGCASGTWDHDGDPATACVAWTDCLAGYAVGTAGTAVSDQVCVDVDECATDNGGCDPLTTCTNQPGTFACGACPTGYSGTGATGCINIDDCAPNPCQNGGSCTDGVNAFTCTCTTGYTGATCTTLVAVGSGADGPATVSSGTVNISTTNLASGRSCTDGGDAVSYSVTALTSTTATLSATPAAGCLSANDEVMLINLQGTSAASSNVGNYETLRVSSVAGATVTFAAAKSKYYGSGASDDADLGTTSATQRVVLVRVPNFTTLSVGAGATLTVDAWDGSKGGVLFMRASGAATIAGSISLDGKGYRGGARPTTNNQDGAQGESYGGPGASLQAAWLGAGGGGRGEACASYGAAGGGAGYGTTGSSGTNGCTGFGGATYGDNALTKLFFGSGGGSGGNDNALHDNPIGGLGGTGGGILVLKAASLTVTGSLSARGSAGQGDGYAGCFGGSTTDCWDYSGAGGGGAGGSVYLFGDSLSLGASLVSAAEGAAGLGGASSAGAGGVGRIAVRYVTTTAGSTSPAASVTVGP